MADLDPGPAPGSLLITLNFSGILSNTADNPVNTQTLPRYLSGETTPVMGFENLMAHRQAPRDKCFQTTTGKK